MRHLLLPNIQLNRLGYNRKAGGLVFLLKDNFTTDDPAPLTSPRTCEPGPGTLTVLDTSNYLSIADGNLIWAGAAGGGNPLMRTGSNQWARLGKCLTAEFKVVSLANTGLYWGLSGVAGSELGFVHLLNFGSLWAMDGAFQINIGWNISLNTWYETALVLRAAGGFIFIREKGNSSWVLAYVHTSGSAMVDLRLQPTVGSIGGGDQRLNNVRVLDLPSNGYTIWSDDYSIATQRVSGSVSAGQTFAHEANCLIEWTQTTLPSVSLTVVNFREQDTNNTWRVFINSSGEFTLQEMIAGVPTSRASAAGVIANGHRIIIIADGTTIRGYSNNTLRWTYSSASNFQTATAGEVSALGTGGVVSDLITWPRTLSGIPAASLDAVVNA